MERLASERHDSRVSHPAITGGQLGQARKSARGTQAAGA